MSELERISSGVESAINTLSEEIGNLNQQPDKPIYRVTVIIDQSSSLGIDTDTNCSICPPGKIPILRNDVIVCITPHDPQD
jgi:hypothetical protein